MYMEQVLLTAPRLGLGFVGGVPTGPLNFCKKSLFFLSTETLHLRTIIALELNTTSEIVHQRSGELKIRDTILL